MKTVGIIAEYNPFHNGHAYQIAKAKELISTRTYTLEEIAEQVGYSNVRAFRRAFVKITGDIPSKFNK